MSDNYDIAEEYIGGKREEYLSTGDICMLTALLWASGSKDPSTQVGACFVGCDGKLISVGYNGTPNNWDDNDFPWGNSISDGEKNTKYPYVIHAEMDGILNYKGPLSDFKDSTVYVTLFPCANCAKLLTRSGVKKVIYLFDDRKGTEDNISAKILFNKCGVEYIDYNELKEKDLCGIDLNIDTRDKNQVIKIKKQKNDYNLNLSIKSRQ